MIGGAEDTVAQFRGQLPKAWQSLVVGVFPISMNASHNEIIARAMKVGEEAELRKEKQLASAIVTNAARGRGGVVGLDDTLRSVSEQRLHTLLIRSGYRAPGSHCTSCGYISAGTIENCPYCGGDTKQIEDAVELAVRRVMRSGGEVEVLDSDQDVGEFENIGGLLRY